jgi:hypothetical protein
MYTLAPQLEVANSVVARTLYKSRKNHRQVQSTAGSVRPYEAGSGPQPQQLNWLLASLRPKNLKA